MIHVHQLDGCAPAPLAHYLKALGILRLLAEQADRDARGWWAGDHFRLATRLGREELEAFFLHRYQPTPLVSPWNKGSGFLGDQNSALLSIQNSTSQRFARFRTGIHASWLQLEELSKADKELRAIKAEAKGRSMSAAEKNRIKTSENYKNRLREADKKFKQCKAALIPSFRLNWRGTHREWMDAAMVLEDNGTPKYPALLGTGGNDGRLDFTNNYMQRIGEIFDLDSEDGRSQPAAPAWLCGALWDRPVPGNLSGPPIGQYLPGTAGGANNANGPDSKSLVNPVDFVLMLEGAIVFTSSVSRRLGSSESSRAASPFAVNACGSAYASAAAEDESARGEQWMPLWFQPSTYGELRHLLAEGRAQVGTRPAREPLDLARAVRRLGTARGIKRFQRFGYIERNGQSNLAVPLGSFHVADQPSERLACIDDLDLWLGRLRREARDQKAPARLVAGEKRLTDAVFAVAEHAEHPACWQGVLVQLADIEQVMARGTGHAAQPVPPLRPEWVKASDDGTPEFRLALAFALQTGSIRRHWLPLDPKRPGRFATAGSGAGAKLDLRPEVVIRGRRGADDAIALVERRLVEAAQHHGRHLPLEAAPRAAASGADLAALLAGRVDLDRTLRLARALMALNGKARAAGNDRATTTPAPATPADWPDDAWLAIRLAMLPWPLDTFKGFKLDIGADPAILRHLAAGDATRAFVLASRRLAAAGVRSVVRTCVANRNSARLWAAALAFPITRKTARLFLERLDPSKE